MTTVCPVRLVREDGVQAALELYDRCHRPRADGAGDDRVAWPVAGGVTDQPARTLDDFDVIGSEYHTLRKQQQHARAARASRETPSRDARRRRR